MRKIGVLTSGGDSPGMNAAIRAVVRTGIRNNVEVFGVEQGYKGMIEGRIKKLSSLDVADRLRQGGTFLYSARSTEFRTFEGRVEAYNNLKKHGIEGLVIIGGDGSMRGALDLYNEFGVKCIGVPGTIDNDIYGTEQTIGSDTALNTIVHAVDLITDTASSHNRTFMIEVMGRKCGYLAVNAALATGAEDVLIPEVPYNLDRLVKKIKERTEAAKRNIIIVAEGVGDVTDIRAQIVEALPYISIRLTILGHLQRGGSPTAFDRNLGSLMGKSAVEALLDGENGAMAGYQQRKIVLVPFHEVSTGVKTLNVSTLSVIDTLD